MLKKIIITTIILLSFANTSFACGCAAEGKTSLATSNNQKACQNVFSFITIDFSFLSPRATAADVHVCPPKHFMPWRHKCCTPPCIQPCMPQCCPCTPQCSQCQTKSMTIDDDDEAMLPANDKKETGIMPVTNKQELVTPDAVRTKKTSLFRIDLLRHFKIDLP